MEKVYDLAIIGTGPAGSMALMKASEYKDKRVISFDLGRPPAKRRRQLEGWLGCFPTGDGKIYQDDSSVPDYKDTKAALSKWLFDLLSQAHNPKVVTTKSPTSNFLKRFSNFTYTNHSYQQWEPEDIHKLSKIMADKLEDSPNISMSFDNEAHGIYKRQDHFMIHTDLGEFLAKDVLMATGRCGWRWANQQFSNLGLLQDTDVVEYGFRMEMSGQYLKEMNKSHCSFSSEDLNIGPFHWSGSLIQEDHADMTLASFRSNEARWKSEKAFFSIMKRIKVDKDACKQKERLAKLAFILSGDRVGREKLKPFLKGDNQLSLIPEYLELKSVIEYVDSSLIPNLIARSYFHVPDLGDLSTKIVIEDYQTELAGLYVAGETAGISGIANSALSGVIALERIFNG